MQCLSIKFVWKVLIRYTVSGQDAQCLAQCHVAQNQSHVTGNSDLLDQPYRLLVGNTVEINFSLKWFSFPTTP